MTTVTFDTHLFVRTIQASGIPENQAEAIAEAFRVAQSNAELTTKGDLSELEYRLKAATSVTSISVSQYIGSSH
jgi:hypothetical protein